MKSIRLMMIRRSANSQRLGWLARSTIVRKGASGLFAGDDELTRARCAEEIARLSASYPLDPKERLREGWW
jgi:hypothetical protein